MWTACFHNVYLPVARADYARVPMLGYDSTSEDITGFIGVLNVLPRRKSKQNKGMIAAFLRAKCQHIAEVGEQVAQGPNPIQRYDALAVSHSNQRLN